MIPEVIEISSDESDVIMLSNESDQFSVYSSGEEAYVTASDFSSDENASKNKSIKKKPIVNNTTAKSKSKSKGVLKSSTKKTVRESSFSLSSSPIRNVSSKNTSTVLNSKANESLKSISKFKKTENLSFSLSPSPEPFAPLASRPKSSKSNSPKSLKHSSFSNAVLGSPITSSNITDHAESKLTTSENKISKSIASPELVPALKDNDDFFYNQEMPKLEFSDSEEEQIPLNFAPKKAATKKAASRKQRSSPFLDSSDTSFSDSEEKSKNSPLKETRKRSLSNISTEESTSKSRPRLSNVGDENKIPLAPSKTSFEALHKELLASEPQDLDPLLKEIYNEVLNNKELVKDEADKKTQPINAELGKCKIRCNFPKVDGAHESQIPSPKFHSPIEFSIKLSDNFEQMFYFICKNKNLLLKDMVVEFNGLKIYPRTTPSSLGIAKDSLTVFEVYCEKAYSLLSDKRLEEEKKRFVDEPETPCSETEVDDNSVSLTVRFSRNEDEIFKLKKTTILKKIIESIRKRRNLVPKTKIILEFDGDKLDTEKTVEEAGLEDEDMVNLLIV